MAEKMTNKRGQITIFVIASIAIVGAVIFLFLFRKPAVLNVPAEENPGLFLQKCIREETLKAMGIMFPQGGFIEPRNYKIYENNKVEYLCYNEGYYSQCINQHPMYVNEVKAELANYLKPKIEDCFSSLKSELQKRNRGVSIGTDSEIEIKAMSGKIEVVAKKKISITSGGETNNFERFDTIIVSDLYGLASAAVEAANMEGKYCSFEYLGYMLLRPEIDISKFTMSDGTKIYSVESKKTKEKLNIAIRGCVSPAGI